MTKMKYEKLTTVQSLVDQCRQWPGQARLVCETAVRARYNRHYHPANPNRRRHIIVDAVLAIAVLGLVLSVAFITFVYQRAVQHQQLEMTVKSSNVAIKSGDIVAVHIAINNNSGQTLRDAVLHIPPAAGFTVSDNNDLSLGTIAGHKDVGVDIMGQVIGEVGSAVRVNAVLSYNTSVGTTEEEIASGILPITASPLTLSIELPESLAIGKAFAYSFTIRNTSETATFNNVLLQPILPAAWETITTSVASDPATSAWTFDRVGSLETVQISGQARLLSSTTDAVDLSFHLYTAPEGAPYLQSETALRLPVFTPKVAVRLLTVPPYLTLGKTEAVTIEITNNESTAITGGQLSVDVSANIVDATGLLIDVPTIASGQKTQQTVQLPMRATINPETAFGDQVVALPFAAEFRYPSDGHVVTVPMEPRSIPLLSDLSLSANARFASSEGEMIGVGPWPPRGGEPTTVWVFIQPQNRFNRIDRAVVTGHFGTYVKPTGRQSVTGGGAISVDAAGNLTWQAGTLPDYKALDPLVPSAAIEVQILAPTDDEAEAVTIVNALKINGFDTVAQTTISATGDDIAVSNVTAPLAS